MSETILNMPNTVEKPNNSLARWFAIRVRSRYEDLVANIARNKGFEDFVPLYQARRRWSDRIKTVKLPLFPGYVFCRLDPQHRLSLLTIPGVLHFVGIGKTPIAIDDLEIAVIQSAVRSGLFTEPWPYLEIGERVRLEEGPLAGMEGILVGSTKQQRLIVSVTLLKRAMAITIERHWATPLDSGGRPLTAPFPPVLFNRAPVAI